MECASFINSLGLFLDIVGAALIFKYGLPEDIKRDGSMDMSYEETDKNQIKLGRIYDIRSAIGFTLLIVGFILQIISNYI